MPLLFDLSQEGYPPSKCLKQLKEAVNKFDENKPEWVRQTKEELENLHKLLTNGDPVQRLMKLSKLLATRKLYGQAILTLGLAAEQSVLLAYDYRKHPGYYDLERLIEDGFCKDSRFKEEFKTFRRIKDLRNFVAHGGMQHPGDFKRQPQPVNLQEQYNTAYTQQSELYNSLKNYF